MVASTPLSPPRATSASDSDRVCSGVCIPQLSFLAPKCPRAPLTWDSSKHSVTSSPVTSPPLLQIDLLHKAIQEASVKKKCEDALSLIHSAWQRSDSLCRGRASRDPWC